MSLRCRLGFHRWEIVENSVAGGFVKRATDECQRCGKRREFEYVEKIEDGLMEYYV